MKLMEVKRNFQVLLVPNYHAFRITVIYVKAVRIEDRDMQRLEGLIHLISELELHK